ncbi:MAG: hypothetical protein KDA42_04705 [Planctomycetales bacterium]|nr:hypothetical protein [Planctomycetales bacterium]
MRNENQARHVGATKHSYQFGTPVVDQKNEIGERFVAIWAETRIAKRHFSDIPPFHRRPRRLFRMFEVVWSMLYTQTLSRKAECCSCKE